MSKVICSLVVALSVSMPALASDNIRVTYAGSMGKVMDQALGPAFASEHKGSYQGQGQGAYGMARLLASHKITADVFVSITPGPMQILKDAAVDNHRIISNVRQRAVIASLNDTIVPAAFSLRLSQQLAAPFYGIPDSGHFLGREGVTELPLVASLLQQFWSQSAAGHIPA